MIVLVSQGKGEAITAKQSLDHAIEHSFERASVVREKQLLAEALMHGVGCVSVLGLDGGLESGLSSTE